MAHEGIYATKAECDAKAGELVNATGWSEANINAWCAQAEGLINCTCRKVFAVDKTAFDALGTTKNQLLAEVASNLVGIYGISYNMAGYVRLEAEDMINVLRDAVLRGLSILREQKTQDFIDGT